MTGARRVLGSVDETADSASRRGRGHGGRLRSGCCCLGIYGAAVCERVMMERKRNRESWQCGEGTITGAFSGTATSRVPLEIGRRSDSENPTQDLQARLLHGQTRGFVDICSKDE